jgi:VWFA-related protein
MMTAGVLLGLRMKGWLMYRTLAYGALAMCVMGALVAAEQQPTFRGTSDAVRVFATVTDRDGRIVTTLSQNDFEVRDDGKPQPITLFDNSPQPIRLIVMLDVSGSMEGNLPLLRAASEQLFARLRPDDLARVGSFGREITIAPAFAHDAETLQARAAGLGVARCAHAAVARGQPGDGRLRRGSERGAPGDPRAERRQGQRPHQLP